MDEKNKDEIKFEVVQKTRTYSHCSIDSNGKMTYCFMRSGSECFMCGHPWDDCTCREKTEADHG